MAKPASTFAATFPLAAAAFESGKFIDAEKICLAILAGQTDNFDASNLLAIVQFLRGDHILVGDGCSNAKTRRGTPPREFSGTLPAAIGLP
jgi:hypothetical protein